MVTPWRHAAQLAPWMKKHKDALRCADDIFKRIFFNENVWISITISLKFVPKGPINNIPAMVQIMAWRRPGDKPLSEKMLVGSLTHICVTRPQWVYNIYLRDCMLQFFFDVGITWHIWRVRHRKNWTLTNELSGFPLDVFRKLGTIHYLQKCMDLKVPVLPNSTTICTPNICWGNIHLTSRNTFDMPTWQWHVCSEHYNWQMVSISGLRTYHITT